ncbi:MAG: hypothetical protein RDU14_04190 [Melioribacteraceae bacterium]|nr:hypothetical protein [Melioribacteraceae bacterium]
MKKPNEVKKNVQEKNGQIVKEQKESSCCGPTCCGGSNENKNTERKEK